MSITQYNTLPPSTNNQNGIYSMVPAALGKASQIAKFRNAIIDSIHWDIRPLFGAVGQQTNILYPNINASNPQNIGSGKLVYNKTDHNVVPLTITQKISNTYPLPIEISSLSDVDLMALYFQGWLEETVRACGLDMMNQLVNGDAPTPVGSPVTPSTKTPAFVNQFTGTGVGHPSRQDIATASGELFQAGVPLGDGDLFGLTSGTPYFGMTADPAYSQSYFVGEQAAIEAQQGGQLKMLNGAVVLPDQYFPSVAPANGNPGKYYTMIAHKIAHGGRFVTETVANNRTTFETFVYPKPNMPVRVSIWFNPDYQCEVVSFNVVYGVTTIRPDWRVMIAN